MTAGRPAGRAAVPPARAAAREAVKREGRVEIAEATGAFERGAITEGEWQRRVAEVLARAYLLEDDARWQSGYDGDAAQWREARELVLDPVGADGSFLDIGCATGLLMESVAEWGRERGHALTVYGLELNADLARAARRRLPAWADRIFEGNASDWTPPRRFTYVRTGLEYAPPGRGGALAARLLRDVVEPGGRLIVGPVHTADAEATAAAVASAGWGEPGVCRSTGRDGRTRTVFWVTAPDSRSLAPADSS